MTNEAKPRVVKYAIALMWATVGLGVASGVHHFTDLDRKLATMHMVRTDLRVLIVILLSMHVYLIMKISARKNWARMVNLVLCMLGGGPFLAMANVLHPGVVPTPAILIQTLMSGVQSAFGVVAVYLLFTESSNRWFGQDVGS
jgi:hypothetical protein